LFNHEFVPLNGNHIFTDINQSKDNYDVDLAVTKLDQPTIQKFLSNSFSFYDMSFLNVDHDHYDGPRYLVVGYPISKTKLNKKEVVFKATLFRLTTKLKFNYRLVKANPNLHLLLDYRRRRIKKINDVGYSHGPRQKGMSGSGVWVLPNLAPPSWKAVPYILTGIYIEHEEELNTIVVRNSIS
jgi:hypothetical protein